MLKYLKTRTLLRILHQLGFEKVRQSGSHLILKNYNGQLIIVPIHKIIKPGLLNEIIKNNLKMTKEDFEKLI